MIKKLSNDKGNTLIELIMVMLLLVLFGAAISTLIATGSRTQKEISQNKTAQVDARIALSYINVKLRQNDSYGKIDVIENSLTGENAILIRNEKESYDMWIYYYDGELLEFIGNIDELPTYEASMKVVNVSGITIEYDSEKKLVKNTVMYNYDEREESISNLINIKSGIRK